MTIRGVYAAMTMRELHSVLGSMLDQLVFADREQMAEILEELDRIILVMRFKVLIGEKVRSYEEQS